MYTISVKFETRPHVEFNIKELSFIEYKELCKSLYYEENVTKIIRVLELLLKNSVTGDIHPQNIIEKILVLLELRALTLGTDIRLKIGEKNFTIEKDFLTSTFNKPLKMVEFCVDEIKLNLTAPTTYLLDNSNSADIISKCLESIVIKDETIYFNTLSISEQKLLLNMLPGIPITRIMSRLKDVLVPLNLTIDKEFYVSPFNSSIVYLLKAILIEPYSEVLDMEYNLRRSLSMGTYDLQHTPYPECKIMLAKLYKDSKERENNTPSIGGPIDHGV